MEYQQPQIEHIVKSEVEAHTNEHTLYIQIGKLGNQKINQVISKLIVYAKDHLASKGMRNISTNYTLNIPSTKDGRTFGHAYCWIENTMIYQILIGNNPDGSPRLSSPIENQIKKSESKTPVIMKPIDLTMRWDLDDDEIDQETVITPNIPQVKIQLPPIVGRFLVKYDKDEYAKVCEEFTKKNGRDPRPDELKHDILVDISPAIAYDVKEGSSHNVLCADRVPKWITPDMVKTKMKAFAPNTRNLGVEIVKGEVSGSVYVTFDEKSMDAAFALQMIKKIEFDPPKTFKNGRKAFLIFDHEPLVN